MTSFACRHRVRFITCDACASSTRDWIQQWTDPRTERPWMCAARTASGYLLHVPGVADFDVPRDGRVVRMTPCTTTTPDVLREVAWGQILPLALSLQSPPVLHASAVVQDGQAIVMVGPSGAGKSTLAAALCRAGASLLADDFVSFDEREGELVCEPTASAVWLHAHAANNLVQPLARQRDAVRACPPGSIDLLERVDECGRPQRIPLQGRDAVVALFGESYRIDPGNRDAIAREFSRLSKLVASTDVHRLRVPRGFSHVEETLQLLMPDARR